MYKRHAKGEEFAVKVLWSRENLNWLTNPLCSSTRRAWKWDNKQKLQAHVRFINAILNTHRHFDMSLRPAAVLFIC